MTLSDRLCAITSIGLLVVSLTACLLREATTRSPADMRDLIVDVSFLPDGWYVDFPPQPCPKPGREEASLCVQFRRKGFEALAQHELARFPNKRKAASEWQRGEGFFSAGRLTPWETPTELPYKSFVADQFQFACADIKAASQFRLCQAKGQYGEYISMFSTWVAPEYMTFQDVEGILKAIDERMAKGLGKPLPGNSTATPAVR